MTLGTQDIELIKREVAGIRDFYQSRMDSEIPPLKEEVSRVAAQLGQVQEMWRDGERRGILEKVGGDDRPSDLIGTDDGQAGEQPGDGQSQHQSQGAVLATVELARRELLRRSS